MTAAASMKEANSQVLVSEPHTTSSELEKPKMQYDDSGRGAQCVICEIRSGVAAEFPYNRDRSTDTVIRCSMSYMHVYLMQPIP